MYSFLSIIDGSPNFLSPSLTLLPRQFPPTDNDEMVETAENEILITDDNSQTHPVSVPSTTDVDACIDGVDSNKVVTARGDQKNDNNNKNNVVRCRKGRRKSARLSLNVGKQTTTGRKTTKEKPKKRSPSGKRTSSESSSSSSSIDQSEKRNEFVIDGRRFIRVTQPGDGNCLFRSLAHALRAADIAAPPDHAVLRNEIVDHASVNWQRFGDMAKKQHELTRKSSYVNLMRTDGEWGDHSELLASSDLYHVPIRIYNVEGDWVSKENPSCSDKVRPDGFCPRRN